MAGFRGRDAGAAGGLGRAPCTCPHRAAEPLEWIRWCLDPGSNRDGPIRVRRIFLPATAFAAARSERCTRSGSGARLHHRLRLRCPPSALYTFRPDSAAAWLGVASRRAMRRRGFSEFDGIHPARFRASAQIDLKSAASANFAIEACTHGSAAQEAGNKNAPLERGDEEALEHVDRKTGGAGRSRTALDGFAIRCITALLPRRGHHNHRLWASQEKGKQMLPLSLERETRLDLATSTLARLRSTN